MADLDAAKVECNTEAVLAMLEQMMTQNLIAKRDIKKVIRKVEGSVKKAVEASYKSNIKWHNRRQAQKAVKLAIWKKALGGSVSLYSGRSRDKREMDDSIYAPANRYNPRRARSPRTIQMQSYYGKDASMILRWTNSGTADRKTGGRWSYTNGVRSGWTAGGTYKSKGQVISYRQKDPSHSTGRISGSGFFSVADGAQGRAADELVSRIDAIMKEISDEYEGKS